MQKEKFEMMKDFSETINLINGMPIRMGKFESHNRITETLVREMMTDIAYMIFFGNFRNDIKMDVHSIGLVASLFRSYYVQRVDLWHSIYLMDEFNTHGQLPDKYKENHKEIYYKLGASQRKVSDIEDLLLVVETNCCY